MRVYLKELERDSVREEVFKNEFSKGIYGNGELQFKENNSGKVLLNISEYFIRTVKMSSKDISSLLGYALKIKNLDSLTLGRVLYFLASQFSAQNLHIKAEGLFRGALDRFSDSQYEKVECLYFYGLSLKKIAIREQEGEQIIDKSKELAKSMPIWKSSSVNLFINLPYNN